MKKIKNATSANTDQLQTVLQAVGNGKLPVRVGIDAHTKSLYVVIMVPRLDGDDIILNTKELNNSGAEVARLIDDTLRDYQLTRSQCDILAAYEAGALGYSLVKDLEQHKVDTVILAPSTMSATNGKRIKTDKRDALYIARELAYHRAKTVSVPTQHDEAVRDYIRMRDDCQEAVKICKQQIGAFVKRNGFHYEGTYWTAAHRRWLRNLKFVDPLSRTTLNSYLVRLGTLEEQLQTSNQQIEELAHSEEYEERTSKLMCFSGIKELAALSLCVEIGDYDRFPKAGKFMSYLGMTPGERSSGEEVRRLPITKAGNSHLRTLLVECVQSVCHGRAGYKSKELKRRQEGCDPEVIAYADRCSERIKRRYYKAVTVGSKNHNVVIIGLARELAGFIWGMMTDHMESRTAG